MKQNKYDEPIFFGKYNQMERSVKGLDGAGEWPLFKSLLPDLRYKHVLDLGCGFGWHCRYVREHGASRVVGVDISEKMLVKARDLTDDHCIEYINKPIEDFEYLSQKYDLVLSSLALHYIDSFDIICQNVFDVLEPGGMFIFSVEHPIFTSNSKQDWYYDSQGNPLHWPVDQYFIEGKRDTSFLTENVIKYHRTVSTYISDLLHVGFQIKAVKESLPNKEMLEHIPNMKEELRRPMFLIIAAVKS